jgi:hypothetical protein
MASISSKVLYQCSAAFACILLSLFASSTSAPFGLENLPGENEPSAPLGLQNLPGENEQSTEPPIVEGFHFKLSEDILVNTTKDTVLKDYTIQDLGENEELFLVSESSGLDKYSGIFGPSNGYYFLSTLVHVAVVAQEEAALSQAAENSTNNAEKEPRVTVSICINANCGNSA